MNANLNTSATAPAAKTPLELLRIVSQSAYSLGDKTISDAINAQLSKIESEHAALLAVAEIAQKTVIQNPTAWYSDMKKALANLDAIRSQNGGKA